MSHQLRRLESTHRPLCDSFQGKPGGSTVAVRGAGVHSSTSRARDQDSQEWGVCTCSISGAWLQMLVWSEGQVQTHTGARAGAVSRGPGQPQAQ